MSEKFSEVLLCAAPLENDYKHTIYFTSASTQETYFKSKKVYSDTGFSYIRKESRLRYPRDVDDLRRHVNYIMYKNTSHSNKWYYAFITKMEYANDGQTWIYFETDVIQTWMFDYIVKPSFIEREHVDSDEIGEHTIPEGLELGEYICNKHDKDTGLLTTKIVMGSTIRASEMDSDIGAIYGGIYSGVKYYTYDSDTLTTTLQMLANNTKQDAVTSLFIAPQFLIGEELDGGSAIKETKSVNYYLFEVANNRARMFSSEYVPKNKKLFTNPYCYLLVTNGNGASAIYNYEDFNTENFYFKVEGVLCPGCSIRIYPQNYKNTENNFDEGLNLGKFPQCNWATDMYINWLTQNGVNVATSIVNAGAQTLGGFALGGGVGALGGAVSGISAIANTLNEVHKAELMPPQASGNINCGDVVTSGKNNTFHFYHMSIKPEYARIIDEYFSMFGYKCHRVKLPNVNHRANYWYTKTIDVNIDGAIPMDDMTKIKGAYNNGITFWTDANNIKNYAVNNSIK